MAIQIKKVAKTIILATHP